MAITGKIYKQFSTTSQLITLTDLKLKVAGIDDKEDRKLVLAAMQKSGYTPAGPVRKKLTSEVTNESSTAGPSTRAPPTTVEKITTPPKRKRKRVEEKNEFLPDGPTDEAADYGSLEFDEIMDEEVIKTKSTVINRAPVMTAWATIVAERMGFNREEALSIATVYTEMNAMSKGVSLGIYKTTDQRKHLDAVKGGNQPYTDLMGRRIPLLYMSETSQWRALTDSSPTKPSVAFSYISRSFRQTTPHIIGALRLLAESFSPQEINDKAWALYCDFRPSREGWGERSEVRCDTILGLRNVKSDEAKASAPKQDPKNLVKCEAASATLEDHEVEPKRPKVMTLEEYEVALDDDHTFDDVDLDI
ncbi:hypothetical protein K435DRAFT_771969 [Dendrothele bispora CBS 962.96]|uniref:Uncharacterized protein n=1 Tax=Dendrothele bispora (strain CBS 962.96) TaxID=1314807 RepID=A0A4S8MYK3_DENBC|nr:hypothetical protein K435DRAFT_771969 [Dendrothele bispora CBS 962.96]